MKKIFLLLAVIIMASMQPMVAQKSSDYNLRKAMELLEKNDEEGALEYVNAHLKENPTSADGLIMRVKIYRYQEKYGLALSDANTMVKTWKKGSDIEKYTPYWWRAAIYNDMAMYDKALADYDMVYKLVKKAKDLQMAHEVLYQRAQTKFDMNDLAGADADYLLMLQYDETDIVAMAGLMRNMLIREEYDKVIELANKSQMLNSEYSEIYRFRMQAYSKLGETDKAIDDAISYYKEEDRPDYDLIDEIFNKHITYAIASVTGKIKSDRENKRDWEWLRIRLYENNFDYQRALQGYNEYEFAYGGSPTLYYRRSDCYNELGVIDKAIEDAKKCLESTYEDDYFAIERLADIYRENGQYNEAIEYFGKLIEILPTDAYAYYKRGWCYELSGNDEKAMQNYNDGIDVDKDYAYIYLMRGELFLKQNKKEEANADFEYILQMDTIAERGSCSHYALCFLGRNDEALAWMDSIIASAPDDNGGYYDKACLLGRMCECDAAVETLKTAFEKGYRSFAHLEHDDDMDPIRNRDDYKALIAEYKQELDTYLSTAAIEKKEGKISEIPMQRQYGGTYEVPCTVNGLELKFIFDTGASDVTISSVEASFMLKNGYLKESDLKGHKYYSTADGDISEGTTIILNEIKIGDAVLHNVEASVVHSQRAPLLLGQTVLERFGTITIDNINSKLLIKQ